MANPHQAHHLHTFLGRLAGLHPALWERSLGTLELDAPGRPEGEWVQSLPPFQRVELCRAVVHELVRELVARDPDVAGVFGTILLLPGEFGVEAVSEIAPLPPGAGQRAAAALRSLADAGLLIELPRGRCVTPFPVRIAFEDHRYWPERELDFVRRRMVRHFSTQVLLESVGKGAGRADEAALPNRLAAYEAAVELDAKHQPRPAGGESYDEVATSLVTFGIHLGAQLVKRASDDVARLLEASAAAAERTGKERDRGPLLFLLGRFWQARKKPFEALDAYRRAAAVEAALGRGGNASLAHSASALLLRDLGRSSEALAQFAAARDSASEAGDRDRLRDVVNCAASLLLSEKRPREAVEWLTEIVDRPPATETAAELETLLLLGRALGAAGRPSDGIAALRAVQAAALAAGLPNVRAEASLASAEIHLAAEDHARAEPEAQLSHDLYEAAGEAVGAAAATLFLARCARGLDDPARGAERCERALTRSWALRDPALVGALHRERAECLLAMQDPHRAAAEHFLALDAFRRAGAPLAIAEQHLRLATAYAAVGDPRTVVRHLLRAQGLARRYDWGEGAEIANGLLAVLRDDVPEDDWESIVVEVSEEIESGALLRGGDA
ncbi:MAG: hypothetical protein SF028_14010 [Candidatus Sumerlaeia bacterium]|nr:hypothetical protein [Candidatus Sumerlaeia bacterium]